MGLQVFWLALVGMWTLCLAQDSCFLCPAFSTQKPGVECATGFHDCECMANTTRQETTCQCNYVCPAGSQKVVEGCPVTFDDCKCKVDFSRTPDGTGCVPCFRCPAFSTQKPGVQCATGFHDCDCIANSTRQETWCNCDYVCPAGSQKIVEGCPVTFDDCRCKPGYYKTPDGTDCVPCFTCPAFSTNKPGVQCATGFHDCECMANSTRQETRCRCNYVCPAGSQKIVEGCPVTFDDCVCKGGSYRTPDSCDRCYSKTPDETDCLPCFSCPELSELKSGVECATGFHDCVCTEHSTRQEKSCKCIIDCPEGSINTVEGCPATFDDCKCEADFYRAPVCVPCFTCPAFSKPKRGVQCATGFHDCECMENTFRTSILEACMCKYACPAFAKPISASLCPTSFQDCTCDDGYGKLPGEKCGCLFVCPTNSNPMSQCARSADECKCDPGFEMRNGVCVACDFECPEYSTGVSDCTASLSDCKCKEGSVKDLDRGECVVPWNASDSIVFGSIFAACGFFWFLAFVATRCTKKKFVALVPLVVAVGDFLTDILFAVDLLREGGTGFAAAGFCVVAFTMVINVLLSCKLVHVFRHQKSEESESSTMSFAMWMTEEHRSDKILGVYFFLSMFTVESLLISGSKIFDNMMFSVPFSRKQRRLVIGYAVANNFVEDIPQLIIVIASRFVLEQPWTVPAVLNVSFSALSILYFLVIRFTTLVALRAGWISDGKTRNVEAERPAEEGSNTVEKSDVENRDSFSGLQHQNSQTCPSSTSRDVALA